MCQILISFFEMDNIVYGSFAMEALFILLNTFISRKIIFYAKGRVTKDMSLRIVVSQ